MTDLPLYEQAHRVQTRDEAISFIYSLVRDLEANPKDWENGTLERFLLAMASWMEDMDGFFRNTGQEPPTEMSWSLFANILAAARIYE